MLDYPAFLAMTDIEEGIAFLKNTILEGPELVNYFDSVYVSGNIRCVQPSLNVLSFRRRLPHFLPHIWNMLDVTLAGGTTPKTCVRPEIMHPLLWLANPSIFKNAH